MSSCRYNHIGKQELLSVNRAVFRNLDIIHIEAGALQIIRRGSGVPGEVPKENITQRMADFYAIDYGLAKSLMFAGDDFSEGRKAATSAKIGDATGSALHEGFADHRSSDLGEFGQLHPRRPFVLHDMVDFDPAAIPSGHVMTSGGFFILDPDEDDTLHSALGDSFGLLIADGKLIGSPGVTRPALVHCYDGVSRVVKVGVDDFEVNVPSLGKPAAVWHRNLPSSGRPLTALINGFDLTIIGDEVIAITPGGRSAIPINGLALSFLLPIERAPDVGTKVSIVHSHLPPIKLAIQGGPVLVAGGQVVISMCSYFESSFVFSGNSRGLLPMYVSSDPVDGCNRPKSALGIKSDGSFVWSAATSNDGQPVRLGEFSQALIEVGVTDALILDGGGSVRAYGEGQRLVGAPTELRGLPYFLALS